MMMMMIIDIYTATFLWSLMFISLMNFFISKEQNWKQWTVIKGFHHSLKIISINKFLFFILLILQTVLLFSVIYIGLTYQVRLINDVQNIMTPLQEANYNPSQIEQGEAFLKDVHKELLRMQKSYTSLKENILYFSLWIGGIFLIIYGGIWTLTHYIIRKGELMKNIIWLDFLHQWLKFLASSALLYGIFFTSSYFFLKSLVLQGVDVSSFGQISRWLLFVFIAIYYLHFVSLSVSESKSWKYFLKRWFVCGIKKAHLTLPILLISLSMITASIYLVYLSLASENFFLMLLSAFLFIFLMVFARIYAVVSVGLIAKKSMIPTLG
ncbi:hypothetical protein HYX12_03800 [Candidatus Woesearchaeota archaeon]|nr:hypothetical protein [Candidatus Woesearchaeota archaeon]